MSGSHTKVHIFLNDAYDKFFHLRNLYMVFSVKMLLLLSSSHAEWDGRIKEDATRKS
jgi:hypothetical protein